MNATTRWILAIVGLLAANAIAMVVLIAMASDNGGAQVIPAYYEQAVRYDQTIDEAARSRELGWRAAAVLGASSIEVELRDAAGAPVDGARVHVSGYPRARADRRLEVELVATAGGRYRVHRANEAGWHDLMVVAERGVSRFVMRLAVEAP